jgi:hypothetical protein
MCFWCLDKKMAVFRLEKKKKKKDFVAIIMTDKDVEIY